MMNELTLQRAPLVNFMSDDTDHNKLGLYTVKAICTGGCQVPSDIALQEACMHEPLSRMGCLQSRPLTEGTRIQHRPHTMPEISVKKFLLIPCRIPEDIWQD